MAAALTPLDLTLLHDKLDHDLAVLNARQETTSDTPPSELYKIREKFLKKDQYWIDDLLSGFQKKKEFFFARLW